MSDLKDAIRYAIFEKITSPDSEIVDTVLYIRRALKERNQIVPDFESKEKFSIGLIVPISLPPNTQPGHCFDVIQEIEGHFNQLGGGSTNFDTRGSWFDDNEALVRDKSIMITTEMLLKDWQITIDVLRFLIRNEIQLKLQQKCVFLYVDNQTFGDPINLLGDDVNDFPNQDVFGDVDPKCKQYLQQNDTASQATSVNQTATGSGNIQISTSDGANITIHPQHDGLTIDQLWQRTRDEMQRNAEEKIRIKNDLEDSMSELRAQNNQYQKQIETLQDELDELSAKLIESGYNVDSPNQPEESVSGEALIQSIFRLLEPNLVKKYKFFKTESRFDDLISNFQEELYLSLLENRALTDVENHSHGLIVLTHITGRRFVFRICKFKSQEDERKRNIAIFTNLKKYDFEDYKLTDDRFCKVRSRIFGYSLKRGVYETYRGWFIFGTEIIGEKY